MRRLDSAWTNWGTPLGRIGAVGFGTSIYGFDYPSAAPDPLRDLLTTEDVAEIVDTTGWAIQANDPALTFSNGEGIADGTQTFNRWFSLVSPSVLTGAKVGFVSRIDSISGGTATFASLNASRSKTGSVNVPGTFMNNLVATGDGPITMRTSFSSGVSGVLGSHHFFDLDAMLARPWFICLDLGSQSNRIGSNGGGVIDPAIDTPAWGTLTWPGQANTARGWEADTPALTVDPVTHQFPGNVDGGPDSAFMRTLRQYIPDTYTPMNVATAYAGQGYSGANFWNKDAANSSAYDEFWRIANAVWAAAPTGSIVGLLTSCGGESDIGAGSQAERDTRFKAHLAEVRAVAEWQAPKGGGANHGDIPLVIGEIGGELVETPNTTAQNAANYAAMVTLQASYDSDSGSPNAINRCKYVPRPAVSPMYAGDGLYVHYQQPAHRQRGQDWAEAARDLIYA